VAFMVGESYEGWRRREVASEADGPGKARETAAAGGCCGLGDGCRMWWRGGVERREVAIEGRHMRATESQKGKPAHDDFGAGAGGRDRTTEIAQRQNRWLRLQDGRTAERQATLTVLISSIDINRLYRHLTT
jgi:hypothetical protein